MASDARHPKKGVSMKTEVDLIIHSAGQLCVIPGPGGPQRGAELGELGIIENGAVAVQDGRFLATGSTAPILQTYTAETIIDVNGRCVIPGFVDPHTHIPWMGDRAEEFEQRLAGASYMQIMAAGGGIMSTVHQVRQASLHELIADNLPRLDRMLRLGTTSMGSQNGLWPQHRRRTQTARRHPRLKRAARHGGERHLPARPRRARLNTGTAPTSMSPWSSMRCCPPPPVGWQPIRSPCSAMCFVKKGYLT
ncbi:MAG: hypothetical protein M5U34_17855 [Chloroflexi bacterium]|nr:hypothetical protein [Chloroflexota bacterium]